ncbi:MAG: hypothetical protein PHU91_03820, partial [Candidatus Omnitrophica bacterium]|nr:hypothetical protein [Candidatus Omnitrophota bacterium]
RKYNHGEAVAIGMVCALEMSHRLKILDKHKLEKATTLIRSYGLPIKIKGVALKDILTPLYYDKKFIGKRTRFVLVKDIGRAVTKENIPIPLARRIIADRFK